MTTIAPADTAAPGQLACGCEEPTSALTASKAKYRVSAAKQIATTCWARRSVHAEPSRLPV
jgi:hypothetical protein